MSNLRLHLPVGPSGPTASASDLQAMQQALAVSGFDGGSAPWRTYTFNQTPTAAQKEVRFIHLGAYQFRESNLELQISGSTMAILKQQLGRDIPIPQRIICGPVSPRVDIPTLGFVVQPGRIVADLSQESFTIIVRDQKGYYLDPIDYFQLIQHMQMWDIGQARCPLIPNTDPPNNADLNIAGPILKSNVSPYLVIGGSIRYITAEETRRLLVHNPPDPLPNQLQFLGKIDQTTSYFSFSTDDELFITIRNLANNITPKLKVKHIAKNKSWETSATTHSWTFALESKKDTLEISHETYRGYGYPKTDPATNITTPRNGSYQPISPLAFELRISWQENGTKSLKTTIKQDVRDTIRQEYRYHSDVFQNDNKNLPQLTRAQVEFNTPPDFVEFYKTKRLVKSLARKNNYHRQNWLLNVNEVYAVIEFIHRRFGVQLSAIRTADTTAVPISATGDIRVTSSWRNPERNEIVGGVRRSNHQLGRALDLKSKHRLNAKPVNVPLNRAMFEAGRDFLSALVALNPNGNFVNVEILVETQLPNDGTYLLWKYIYKDSSIKSIRGSNSSLKKVFKKKLGLNNPPQDNEAALTKALQCATHIHIGWRPGSGDVSFTLPQPDPMPAYSGYPYRNIILVSALDNSLFSSDQPPLDFLARTLKTELETIYPNIPTHIRLVHHPIEFFKFCNLFRDINYKVHHLICISRATLTHFELTRYSADVPYQKPEGETGDQIHSQELLEEMEILYTNRFEFDTEGDLVVGIETGEDDYTQLQTHQLRVYNMTSIEGTTAQDAKDVFSESEGVFFIGFAENEPADYEGTFELAQSFANLIQRPVYGRIFNNEFLAQEATGKWQPTDITRENAGDTIREESQPNDPTIIPKPSNSGFQEILNESNDEWGLSNELLFENILELLKNPNMLQRYDPEGDSSETN